MRLILSAILLLIITPAFSFAHALGVDCTLRGHLVEVEAFYDDNTPARSARVHVIDAQANLVAQGTTDGEGRWSFTTPPPGAYEVRVDAGAGHRAKAALSVPATAGKDAVITTGPPREEFTSFPWLKVAIGLVVIGGCSGAFLLATRWRKSAR